MKKISSTHKHELVVYIIIWVAVFLTPIISQAIEVDGYASEFCWPQVLNAWKGFTPFLLLFVIHDLFVAPLLKPGKGHKHYMAWLLLLIAAFALVQFISQDDHRPPHVEDAPTERRVPQKGEVPPPPRPLPTDDSHEAVESEKDMTASGQEWRERPHKRPVNSTRLINIVLAITMCGLGAAVKLYFRSSHDKAVQKELEKESLLHELEYLRYQINPHFFMNTLNNIHALVDIDPERAKRAIIELSVLMRYVLYGGREEKVPLKHELEFITHYIALMRLRFTNKVDVETAFPNNVQGVKMPPLLYATFIENAFKHGISYRHPSFVHVSVEVCEGLLKFRCINSLVPPSTTSLPPHSTTAPLSGIKSGGIGLENARKRLTLIYHDHYTLNINRKATTFEVELTIPANND